MDELGTLDEIVKVSMLSYYNLINGIMILWKINNKIMFIWLIKIVLNIVIV